MTAANVELDNKAIYPYIQLEFAEGYDSENRTINETSVNLGGSDTPIYNKEGNEASSLQQLKLDTNTASEEVTFYNLPKYDMSGSVASYTVKEVWNTENKSLAEPITSKAGLKKYFEENLQSYDKLNELLNLLDEFSTNVRQDSYTSNDEAKAVDGEIPHDTQAMTVTNGLGNTKDVVWYKHWNDQYVFDQNQRPDIYIDVYRVVHDSPTTTKVELVKQDYLWEPRPADGEGIESDEIDQNSWKVTMSNVQKYDSYGYEIYYYATESTMVDYPSYDYVVGDYYQSNTLPLDPDLKMGTADAIDQKYVKDGSVIEFANSNLDESVDEDKVTSPDYAAYALKENGMFVNSLDEQVNFQGQKIWEAVPNGYSDVNLPAVTFELYRTTKPAKEVLDENGNPKYSEMTLFDTETVSDWANAHQNGTYVFNFTDGNGEKLNLPRYDEEGNVYTYYMREKPATLGENGPALKDVFTVTDPESNTYVATNHYNPPEGELHVKKFLQLPADLGTEENDKFPTIQFTLTRTYTGTDKDGNENATIEDTSFKKAIEWEWQDVKDAYAAAKAEEAGESVDTITLTNAALKFENLEIYAPNGSKFVYTVTETSENFLYGYSTYAELGNLAFDDEKLSGDENETTVSGLEPVVATESEYPEATLDTQSDEPDKSWATFKNVSTQKRFTELEGSKEWDDYNDQFGIRPSQDAFKKILTVTRTAKQQGTEGNQITETLAPDTYTLTLTADSSNDNRWTYTITSTNKEGFEVYAPNGMPWTYTVKEDLSQLANLTGIYKGAPSSVSIDATTIGDDGIGKLEALKNSTSTSVNFEKKWKDSDGNAITEDYLGRKLSVTFQLQVRETENGEWTKASTYFAGKELPNVVKFEQTLSGNLNPSTTWSGSFTKLPLAIKDDNGEIVRLEYRVVETSVDVTGDDKDPQTITITGNTNEDGSLAYDVTGNGLVTNATLKETADGKWITTNTLDLDSLTITKVWNDGNNQFGTRPSPGGDTYTWTASFIVQRQENGEWKTLQSGNNEDKVFTLYGNEKTDGDTDHTITISGLPEGTYRVIELEPDFVRDDSGAIPESFFVNNNDSFYNGMYTAQYNSNEMDSDENTTMAFAVTNTLNTRSDISVKKVWRPSAPNGASIDVVLQYSNDGEVWRDLETVTLNSTTGWTHTWTNLPAKYPANAPANTTQYRVVERNAQGGFILLSNEPNKDGTKFTITNVATTNLDVTKVWKGFDDNLPEKITVQLYRTMEGHSEETKLDGKTLTLNAENNWQGSFTNLEAYDAAGNEYTYFAREVKTGDYDVHYQDATTGNAFSTVITNVAQTGVTGTKTWKDNSNKYNTRPFVDEMVLTLYRSVNGEKPKKVENVTPEWSKTDSDQWTYTYKDLPKTDVNGNVYTYTVEETLPDGSAYVCTTDGFNLTNTLTGKVEVSGTKTWVGGRPAELQLTLSRSTDGEEWPTVDVADGQPTWANTDTDKWTYTYSDLPKYDENGVLYRYKVAETVPQDYDSAAASGEAVAVEGGDENVYTYDFTNVKKGALTVEKIVQGNRGETDRAFTFTVTLTGKSQTSIEANTINGKFGDMTFENGVATFTLKHGQSITASGLPAGLTYTVEETNANADGYTTSNSGNTGTIPSGDTDKVYFTNTKHEGEALTTSVSVQKVWKIDNGGEQPEFVKVQLEKDGQPYGNPVTLNDKNGWKYEWKDLPLGFTWTVEEVDAPEGFTSYTNNYDNHFVITNDDVDTEQKPETVNVRKVWVIDDGGERPDSVSVQLMRDGEPFGDPVTLNDANDWSYAWNDLESGHNWTVVELNVPDGFKATVSQSGDTFTIINDDTTEETTEIRANKEWTIDNGGTRADSVTVQLYCDGQPWGDPVTLSDSNDWTTLWEELPVGHSWSVVEINVPAGFTSSVTQEDGVITITNDDIPTDIPDPDDPEPEDPDDPTDIPDPEKPDTDDPDDPTDIPDTEKPDDNEDPDNPTTPSNPSSPSSPSTPGHSTTPGTSGTTTTTTTDKSDDKDAPQTGDNTHTRALFALCLASLAGMTVIGVSRKRQRKDDSDQS